MKCSTLLAVLFMLQTLEKVSALTEDNETCTNGCPIGQYGDLCQFDKLQHTCAESGKIVINVNVEEAHVIYVYNETTCPLGNTISGEIPGGWEGPLRVINTPSDTDCGDADPTENEDGTTRYCVTAYIRFFDNFWSRFDFTATYCCSGTEVSGIEVASIIVDDELPGTTVPTVVPASSDIRGTFHKSDGTQITGAAIIGNMVELRLRLASGAAAVGLKPLKCAVTGDPDLSDGVQIVKDGCPIDVLNCDLTYNQAASYDLEFEMIKFVGSDRVYVVCDIRLCLDEDNCVYDGQSCDQAPNERKKRSIKANSTSEEVKHFVTYITVGDPFLKNQEEANTVVVDRAATINFSAVVIGLAVVLFILLVAGITLAAFLLRKRTPPNKKV